jgi:hypothetical protein
MIATWPGDRLPHRARTQTSGSQRELIAAPSTINRRSTRQRPDSTRITNALGEGRRIIEQHPREIRRRGRPRYPILLLEVAVAKLYLDWAGHQNRGRGLPVGISLAYSAMF